MRLFMIRDRGTRLCAWALVALLLGSCSSGPVDPATLRLTASTTGLNLDPDGYTYSVDGGASAALGPAETVVLNGLIAGAHELAISGVASNCNLDGGTPRAIVLIPGDTTDILLTITCQAPASPAALTLTTSRPAVTSISTGTPSPWTEMRPFRSDQTISPRSRGSCLVRISW